MRYGLILLEAIGTFLHSGCLASAKLQKEGVNNVCAWFVLLNKSVWVYNFKRFDVKITILKCAI